MRGNVFKKGLIIGIIVLFVGAIVLPSTGSTVMIKSSLSTSEGNILYVGGSGPGNYSSIQVAIDDANPGDTVFVYDDSSPYYENVVIDKTINLIGEDKNTTIVDGDTTSDGVPDGDCITISANGVTIDGFEIKNGYSGIIGETDNSVIKNNIIHDNLNYNGYNGMGICFWGDNDDNQILNNEIYNNDRQGIFIGYEDTTEISSGNTISGNEIYNNGLYTQPNGPDASAYGIQLWNSDGNTIDDNEVYNHDDWFPYGGDFDFAQGIYLCDSFNNIVTKNDLYDNNYGVGAWSPDRTPVSNQINYNYIYDNTGYGVINYDVITLDAENNWWGDCSGPTHASNPNGTGDNVSDNVDFDPWIIDISAHIHCEGSLSWTDVEPGATLTGNFTIENIGYNYSELSWEVKEWPTWGTWTFTPSSGNGLTPAMGQVIVQVSVIAPPDKNKEFTGKIKIINTDDPSEYCEIPVVLKTPKSRTINSPLIKFLQNHQNLLPILQKLLYLIK